VFGIFVLLFVLLFPAAFIGGLVHGKIGLRFKKMRTPITIVVYILLAPVTLPLVTG
jgi:hypothetical protein